ncbi:MAG: transglycosylase SLT domain-containing protein [Burkholderiaceae bacterium]|nr:transglycosylase SLT domain-containing protein [Burkholderiaceae bacterium]
MRLSPPKTLIIAALFCAGISPVSYANDLSLHPSGRDFHLAALSPSVPSGSPATMQEEIGIDDISITEVDVWERMRQGFGIPDLVDNPLVSNQLEWYSARPDYIARTTGRASRYLFHIVQELEARGMPTELALLPFIESAFNPNAVSTAKAAGMWQFIPSTGRNFNLKQSSFKDDRRSVLASTDAALNYLQMLHNMFGDWQLALAAYNWGEGSVQRAIKKNEAAGLPTDFNSLSARMPAETRNYVPKLQAVKHIIANPAKYGIELPKIENQPYFVTIGKTRDMDVKVAAQLAELPLDEFRALNPQFGKYVITGGTKTRILLPHENADKFKANLAKWGTDKALCSWTAHKVTDSRERIEAIAEKYGTTADVIREANRIPPKMVLKAGSTVLVPKPASLTDKDISPEIAENAKIAVERDAPPLKHITVKVGKKDSLASIAKKHRVSVGQIKAWNKLHGDKVAAGTKLDLHVPHKASAQKRGKQLAKAGKRDSVKRKSAGKKKTVVAQAKPRGKAAKKRAG